MRLAVRAREGRGAAHAAWALAVKERDGYVCQGCGRVGRPVDPRGPRVEAHHILPWTPFPAHRFDLANGRTLSIDPPSNCHGRLHPGMGRRRRRRPGLWRLAGGFLLFWTVWYWFAPDAVALRPTRAAIAYVVLLVMVRLVRRLRR